MVLLLSSCLYSFLYAEDQRIPAAVFGVLFTATQDALTSASSLELKPSMLMLKRWLSILVKRSLFLELVRGSIHLHGIAPSNHTLIIMYVHYVNLLCYVLWVLRLRALRHW